MTILFQQTKTEANTDTPQDYVARRGPMGVYLKAIMMQVRDELSRGWPVLKEKWLLKYLKEHGFWIRKEYARTTCEKLHANENIGRELQELEFVHEVYCRHVRLWLPIEYGYEAALLRPKKSSNFSPRLWLKG